MIFKRIKYSICLILVVMYEPNLHAQFWTLDIKNHANMAATYAYANSLPSAQEKSSRINASENFNDFWSNCYSEESVLTHTFSSGSYCYAGTSGKAYSSFARLTKTGSGQNVTESKERFRRVRLGFYYNYGFQTTEYGNISAVTINRDGYNWQIKPSETHSFDARFFILVSKNFGFTFGVGYSQYKSLYQLNGTFTDIYPSYDINGDKLFKIIEAKYDSTINIQYMDIPVGLTFFLLANSRFQIHIIPTVNICLTQSAQSISDGNIYFYGYYPENKPAIQYIDWPELGFYHKDIYNRKRNIKENVNQVIYNANLRCGFDVHLSEDLIFSVSGNLQYTINDLKKNSESTYKDLFLSQTNTSFLPIPENDPHTHPYKKTRILQFGVTGGFIFKL